MDTTANLTKLHVIRNEFERNIIRRLFKTVAVSGANTPALADFAMDLENAAKAIRMRIDIHRERRRMGVVEKQRRRRRDKPSD